MSKHLKYAWYVLRHKWFVTVECFKQGLFIRGVLHDLSKLLPGEWFPYVEFFYGDRARRVRDSTGYYKPTDTGDAAFDFAWLLHQKRNDHHWQWWILPEGEGGSKVLPMSEAACLEMMCDWCGASRAQGHGGWTGPNGTHAWYEKHKGKMRLHPETRARIEQFLSGDDRR